MSRARFIFVGLLTLAGALIGADLGVGGAMFCAGGCGIVAMYVSREDVTDDLDLP